MQIDAVQAGLCGQQNRNRFNLVVSVVHNVASTGCIHGPEAFDERLKLRFGVVVIVGEEIIECGVDQSQIALECIDKIWSSPAPSSRFCETLYVATEGASNDGASK